MRTIVFQSDKPGPRPSWLNTCLKSVRDWAAQKSFDYRFIEDELFEMLPKMLSWREHRSNIYPLTDLARVLYAKMLVNAEQWHKAIWIDADVFIADPRNFGINLDSSLTFCREIWTWTDFQGSYSVKKKVNNCIFAATRGTSFLEDYPETALKLLLDSASDLSSLSVGTDLFTTLEQHGKLNANLVENTLLINPFVMREFYRTGSSDCARLQKALLKENVSAFHFANSFTKSSPNRIHVDDADFATLAKFLIENPASALL